MNDALTDDAEIDLENSKNQLKKLFSVLAIEKLVVVDDVYSAKADGASITANCRAIIARNKTDFLKGVEEFKDLDFDDSEIWPKQLGDLIEELEPQELESLALKVADHADGSNDNECEKSKLLKSLFNDLGISLLVLSLGEWNSKEKELINNQESTLFLFDKDMTNNEGSEDQGIKIAVTLLKSQRVTYCGVISNSFNNRDETLVWEDICEQQQLEEYRDLLGILPKSKLQEDLNPFVHTIKRIAIAPKCSAIKQRVSDLVGRSFDTARQELDRLSVYEFEQVVFQSSYQEGVWEPDTLIKIFALFQESSYKQLAHSDLGLADLVNDVRDVVVSTPGLPIESPTNRVARIRTLELYDEQELINKNLLPLEVGDVFQKYGSSKQKVLIAQPCDLMLRKNGKRSGTSLVACADLILKDPKDSVGSFELPCFQADGQSAWVRFRRYELVPIEILDLVCFSREGKAALSEDTSQPKHLLPGAAEAFKRRLACIKTCLNKYKLFDSNGKLSSQQKKVIVDGIIQCEGSFVKPKFDIPSKSIDFGIQRTRRIKPPQSLAILRKFSSFISRDAFDHDITQTIVDE